jgi:hypothetical protein
LLIDNFCRPEKVGDKDAQLAATEGDFTYHGVSHNHSFRSMDCTKAETVILKMYKNHDSNVLYCDLEKGTYISELNDASNHKDQNFFPALVM